MFSSKISLLLASLSLAAISPKPTPKDVLVPPAAIELRPQLGASKPALPASVKDLDAKLAAITPLSRKQLFALAPAALAAAVPVEPESFVLSASQPVQGRATLHVYGGSAIASPDGHGRVMLNTSTVTAQGSYFEVAFPTRAGRGYLIDCAVAGASTYFVAGGGAGFRSVPRPSGGHLTFGLRIAEQDGNASLMVAGDATFALSHCQVVSVK